MKLSRFLLLSFFCASSALAADPKVETVLEGLINPCGVAIQPDTGVVFVSDSGAGKVVKVVGGKAVDVIANSPKDLYGKGPKYDVGPLGIAFFDKNTLVVGDGGYVDGKEFVRVFTLPEGNKALDYEADAKTKAGPLDMTERPQARRQLLRPGDLQERRVHHQQWRRHQGLGAANADRRHEVRQAGALAGDEGSGGGRCARRHHAQQPRRYRDGANG